MLRGVVSVCVCVCELGQATAHGKDPSFPRRVPKKTEGGRESHVSSGFGSAETVEGGGKKTL